jgi:hypothetical protein
MGIVSDLIETGNNLHIVNQLNKLFSIDPELTKKLVDTRHPVTQAYKDSEFVYSDEGAGLIGVLSGLTLNTTKFRIAADYNDSNELTGFCLLELTDGKFVRV